MAVVTVMPITSAALVIACRVMLFIKQYY